MEDGHPAPEPAALIEEARRGSEPALNELVRLYQARVRTYLSRFLRKLDIVDDLAQETFLTAFRKLPSYKGEARFSTWLLGVARYHALMHLREEGRRVAREGLSLEASVAEWLVSGAESEGAATCDHERALDALEACLRSLPERSARLIADHYFNRRIAAEMARAMDREAGSVWMMLSRIRRLLRRCVEQRLGMAGASL